VNHLSWALALKDTTLKTIKFRKTSIDKTIEREIGRERGIERDREG
jgi:hypothetical protein